MAETAIPTPQPTPPIIVKKDNNPTHRGLLAYRVDSADSIETIANQFSTTPARIREMNQLNADQKIKPGDEIMVPTFGAVAVGR